MMSGMDDDVALQNLVAKQAITEALFTYCRALDRMDKPAAYAVWHAGGTADYGSIFTGTGAEFIDWVWQSHELMDSHSHQITNVLVEVDGEQAVSESYVTVALRFGTATGEPTDIVTRGRYLDRWSRVEGRWAIDQRAFVDDFNSAYAVGPMTGADSVGARTRRDPSDLSYSLFSGPDSAS